VQNGTPQISYPTETPAVRPNAGRYSACLSRWFYRANDDYPDAC
jgi:hypothetical protein